MKVIISQTNVSFVSNDLAIMKFYSTYQANIKAIDQVTNDVNMLINNYFKSLTEFSSNSDSAGGTKRDIDVYLDYLQESERRHSAIVLADRKEAMDAFLAHVDRHSIAITNHIDVRNIGLKDHISTHNSSTIAMIDANIHNRLDFSRIAEEIVSMIKIVLSNERSCNDDVIVAKIKEAMHTTIVLPNSLASEKLTKNLQDIKDTWRDNDQSTKDRLNERFNKIIIEGVTDSARIKHVSDIVQQFLEESKSSNLALKISQVPLLVKQTIDETLRGLDVQSKVMAGSVLNLQQQVIKLDSDNCIQQNGITTLQKGSDTVVSMVNDLSMQLTASKSNIRTIGSVGEQTMFQLLEDSLLQRDGYTVIMTQNIPHNCDILVKKVGENHICLEIKTQKSGQIRTREIERFQSDILHMNRSGIFVSIHSGIVGRENFDFEFFPNGRIAVYLGNNNYDVNVIKEMVRVIHHLEAVTCRRACDGVHISSEHLAKILELVKDECRKLENIKRHVKQTIAMLNDSTISAILKCITDLSINPIGSQSPIANPHHAEQTVATHTTVPELATTSDHMHNNDVVSICIHCCKEFKTPRTLLKHVMKCKKKPDLNVM